MRARDRVRGGRTKAILGPVVSVSEAAAAAAAPSLPQRWTGTENRALPGFHHPPFLLLLEICGLLTAWGSVLCAGGCHFFCLRVKRLRWARRLCYVRTAATDRQCVCALHSKMAAWCLTLAFCWSTLKFRRVLLKKRKKKELVSSDSRKAEQGRFCAVYCAWIRTSHRVIRCLCLLLHTVTMLRPVRRRESTQK